MADEAAVLGQATVVVIGTIRGQETIDDHRQHRYVGSADGPVEGEVDRSVFQGREPPVEDGLGQRADEVPSATGDLACPSDVVEPGGAVSLIEGVEAVWHPVAERD